MSTPSTTGPSVNPLFPGPQWTSFRFIDSDVMDSQFKHQLGLALYGMSDIGECLEALRTIGVDDEESWLRAWTARAEVLQQRAELAEEEGRSISAASAYLRASSYWRAGLMHFSFPEDPRVKANALAGYHCYDRYLALSDYPGEYVEIPYEDSFLPSYLYRSPHARGPAPVLIFFQGRDAWPEDTRWVYDGAMRRGYHCLTVQCPGQGMALRVNGLTFRHDWEKVVTPVVDVVVGLDGVDPDRVGLMGASFGGYLAPRAAAFEKRIKLLVANPGYLAWGPTIRASLPDSLNAAWEAGPDAFNAAVAAVGEHSALVEWYVRDSSWKHGVSTPYELFAELDACDLTEVAGRIECETLVMDGTEEAYSPGQAEQLYDALTCPKTFLVFDESTTAQLHCQAGGEATAAEFTLDWLDGRL
ncbi:alpha/beta fold hydrolase [Actinosynnema sp. NPDC023587]|uniref:alpha/beta hydrolase family protein n=1 Tax=Actinosynnema sp. NPDC023587 TaxID=3154695 RepID=UPI0033E1D75F